MFQWIVFIFSRQCNWTLFHLIKYGYALRFSCQQELYIIEKIQCICIFMSVEQLHSLITNQLPPWHSTRVEGGQLINCKHLENGWLGGDLFSSLNKLTPMVQQYRYRWVSARRMYLQCVSNGAIYFLHQPTHMFLEINQLLQCYLCISQIWCCSMIAWFYVVWTINCKFMFNLFQYDSFFCNQQKQLQWSQLSSDDWRELWVIRPQHTTPTHLLACNKGIALRSLGLWLLQSGLILGLHPANDRWPYFVTTFLID